MKHLLLFTSILVLTSQSFSQTTSAPGSVLSTQGGRYVFGQISEYRRDQYLLDSQSGRVWQVICVAKDKDDSKQCNLTALSPMYFTDTKGDLSGVTPPVPTK